MGENKSERRTNSYRGQNPSVLQVHAEVNHYYRFCLEYFRLEPRQGVDTQLVFTSGDGDEDVETLEYFHLLKPTSVDHWIHCSLYTNNTKHCDDVTDTDMILLRRADLQGRHTLKNLVPDKRRDEHTAVYTQTTLSTVM